jgi:hypothetical protein
MEAIVERKQGNIGLLSFLSLNIADSIMTWWLLSLGGTEGNWYQLLVGTVPAWAILTLKMSLAVGIAILVYKYRRHLFRLLNIGMGLVAAINIMPVIAYLVGRVS